MVNAISSKFSNLKLQTVNSRRNRQLFELQIVTARARKVRSVTTAATASVAVSPSKARSLSKIRLCRWPTSAYSPLDENGTRRLLALLTAHSQSQEYVPMV